MCWEVWFQDEAVRSRDTLAAKLGVSPIYDDEATMDACHDGPDHCLCPIDVEAMVKGAGMICRYWEPTDPGMAGDWIVTTTAPKPPSPPRPSQG